MVLNKKGIFFTTLVIVILLLFVLTNSLYQEVIERKSVQNRIKTMNNFVFSIEEDLPRQFYISAFRIVYIQQQEMVRTGTYLSQYYTSANLAYNETFFNGTVRGNNTGEIESIMDGSTFEDITMSITEKARKISAEAQFYDFSLNITQESPWNITFIVGKVC
jgi:site-specific DNA-adenine methylase